MRAAIAAFAGSTEGDIYAMVCRHYGVDPGAIFADDVDAFMMRQALMVRSTLPRISDLEREWLAAGNV